LLAIVLIALALMVLHDRAYEGRIHDLEQRVAALDSEVHSVSAANFRHFKQKE
jgi:hypothetical protein